MSQLERFCEELGNPYLAHEHAHRYWWALPLVEGKSVVDIACGTGYGSAILSKAAEKVIGIDLSSDVVKKAQSEYGSDKVQFKAGDCTSFTVAEPVDVVVTFETLEHISKKDQQAFLERIKAALKPDGMLILSTPNRTEYSERSGFVNEFHVHELNTEELEAFLKSSFRNVRLFGQRFFPVSWISPLHKGEQIPGNQVRCSGLDHRAGVTTTTEQPVYAPVYCVAICTDAALGKRNDVASVLFDIGASLSVVNAAELRQLGNPEEARRLFSSFPERLREMETQFARELGNFYNARQHVDGMKGDLDACKIELGRQIDRISEAHAVVNRVALLEAELGKQIDRISEIHAVTGRVALIEEELMRQIERVSQTRQVLEGDTAQAMRKQAELLENANRTFTSYAAAVDALLSRMESLEARFADGPADNMSEAVLRLKNSFHELHIGYADLQKEYFTLKQQIESSSKSR